MIKCLRGEATSPLVLAKKLCSISVCTAFRRQYAFTFGVVSDYVDTVPDLQIGENKKPRPKSQLFK